MNTRDLLINEKLQNRDAILQYLMNGGEGQLTELQQKLYERFRYADELIRMNIGKKKRYEISELIQGRWNISPATAFQDIINAEYIFCSSTPLNKKYFIQNRIGFLEAQIRDASIAKNYDAVAKLEKVLSSYVQMYPDYEGPKSPKTVIFNVNSNNLLVGSINHEEAFSESDEILKELEDEYEL